MTEEVPNDSDSAGINPKGDNPSGALPGVPKVNHKGLQKHIARYRFSGPMISVC